MFRRCMLMRTQNLTSLLLVAGMLVVSVEDAASSHRQGHFGVNVGTIAWRKLKNFVAQCRANGGTVVTSGYGSGVFACRMRNGRTRFCQAISSSEIQCWSDNSLPPPRSSTGESNGSNAADPEVGGGQGGLQPAPAGPIKPGSGCSGGVC
jgi:hypothetical protein